MGRDKLPLNEAKIGTPRGRRSPHAPLHKSPRIKAALSRAPPVARSLRCLSRSSRHTAVAGHCRRSNWSERIALPPTRPFLPIVARSRAALLAPATLTTSSQGRRERASTSFPAPADYRPTLPAGSAGRLRLSRRPESGARYNGNKSAQSASPAASAGPRRACCPLVETGPRPPEERELFLSGDRITNSGHDPPGKFQNPSPKLLYSLRRSNDERADMTCHVVLR